MKALILALAFLLMAGTASAQHDKHQRGEQHDRGRGHEEHDRGRGHEEHDRGRHRDFDRDHHHRIGDRDRRFRDGHREVFFGGLWFSCGVWPEWVFVDDVYIIQVGDFYYVRSYARPNLMIQVVVVD